MISMGIFIPYFTEIQTESANPVSCLEKDLIHKLKMKNRFSRIEPLEELRKRPIKDSGAP